MQKKLIALAVASLASGAAFAQTNVTMYGIADAGYMYSSGDAGFFTAPVKNAAGNTVGFTRTAIPGTNTFSGIQSGLLSGSRLGFRGEEALGNGLKAIFTLEYSIDIDTNTGVGNNTSGLNSRQQFVGLSGANWGTVALGRQYSPGYQATSNNDPAGGAAFESQSFMSKNAGYTITPNSAARWDNALTYTTPNWGGFSAKAIYSFGETSVATAYGDPVAPSTIPATAAEKALRGSYNDKLVDVTDNSKYGVGLNYANGPLNLDAVYQGRESIVKDGGISNPYDTNEWYVGGSFDLKMVKLMASWQGMSVSNSGAIETATTNDSQMWAIGAVIPVLAASNIHLGYSQLLMDGRNRRGNINEFTGNSQSAMAGWTTNLSKRTTFYAGYVWVQNDNNSAATGPVTGVGARGQDNNTVLAGLRHMF